MQLTRNNAGTSATSITENFTTTTSSRPTSTRTTLTAAATTPPPIKAMSLQPKPTLPASILRMKPGYETCDSCHTCSEYCEMKSKRVWIVVVLWADGHRHLATVRKQQRSRRIVKRCCSLPTHNLCCVFIQIRFSFWYALNLWWRTKIDVFY